MGQIQYTYDANGNVLTVTDSLGTITRTYDALNRVTAYTDTRGNSLAYQYDAVGNLTRLTYPDGKQVQYAYDVNDQLITVTDWASRVTQYAYDANGRLSQTTRPNGTQQLRSYDAKGQLLTQTEQDEQGQVLFSYQFSYDAVGNIVAETVEPNLATLLPANTEMSYGLVNRLATVDQQSVTLDADGNMVEGVLQGALTQFSYDARNRLIQAGSTQYQYDAENQRIAVDATQFVVNSQPNLSQVLVRTKGNGEVTYYVYGLGLIGEQSAGNYFSYHFDYRGSTVAITDTTGQVIDTVQYSPFGVVLSQPTFDTPFLFNGLYGVMTDDNSLSYMRARYYSAEIRRFVNQDVLLGDVADGQSLNRFAFVTGNPVSFVDPFGLSEMLGGEYLDGFDTEDYEIYFKTLESFIKETRGTVAGFFTYANFSLAYNYIFGNGAFSNVSHVCSKYLSAPEIQKQIEYVEILAQLSIRENNIDKIALGQSVRFRIEDKNLNNLTHTIYAFGFGVDRIVADVTASMSAEEELKLSYKMLISRDDGFADPIDLHQYYGFGENKYSPVANLYIFSAYDFGIDCPCRR